MWSQVHVDLILKYYRDPFVWENSLKVNLSVSHIQLQPWTEQLNKEPHNHISDKQTEYIDTTKNICQAKTY